MSAKIRLGNEGDADDIASVLFESFKEYEPFYAPGGFAATTRAADRILKRMQEGPIWIALIDNECRGTVAAVPQGETLYIRANGRTSLRTGTKHRRGNAAASGELGFGA